MKFKKLFTPIRIGSMQLRNRIVMLPITTGYNEVDEIVGDRLINFFVERAKGGAGLIIVPFSPINSGSPLEPGLWDDKFISGLHGLTSRVHDYGANISSQLVVAYHIKFGKVPEIVGPSPIYNMMMRCVPRELTINEIKLIIEEYKNAARRAIMGGFDSIDIPIGGGYLLNRFLSPISNKRQDEYGGSLENRMRIILEIIESTKKELGDNYPISCRLNLDEQMENGIKIGDSKEIARILEMAGIDMIISYTGWHESNTPTIQAMVPQGAFVHLAEEIKKNLKIPVVATNRINDPISAENIIASKKADLVGMARALLADPELPNKAKQGRIEEIVPCLACSNCLSQIIPAYKNWGKAVSTSCTVNPIAGKESEYILKPVKKSKRIYVVGGGAGGYAGRNHCFFKRSQCYGNR